jgi:hypothetical protein
LEWIESLKIVRETVSKEMRRDDEQSRSKVVVINGVNCKQVQRITEDLLKERLIIIRSLKEMSRISLYVFGHIPVSTIPIVAPPL